MKKIKYQEQIRSEVIEQCSRSVFFSEISNLLLYSLEITLDKIDNTLFKRSQKRGLQETFLVPHTILPLFKR